MPTALREQIIAAATTALESISAITGLQVERNRHHEVNHFPTLVVIDGDQQEADSGVLGYTEYTMNLVVEGYVKANSSASLGTAVNALYAEVVKALLADITLGGLAVDVNELSTDFSTGNGEGQRPVGTFLTLFSIIYQTAQGDPFTPAP